MDGTKVVTRMMIFLLHPMQLDSFPSNDFALI